jgi:hypothetical protein
LERTTLHRKPERGTHDRAVAYAILDEAIVCHVGIATDQGPVVIPMVHARDGDRLLLHGSPASRLLRTAASTEICVTVTLIDGLVLARSSFNHSVNYRSVVVLGQPHRLDDLDERRSAAQAIVEAIVPGRTADARPPNEREVRGTTVLALPLDDFSVKVRTGGAGDNEDDDGRAVWAGVIPLSLDAGAPVPDDDLAPEVAVPAYADTYRRPS